MNTHKKTLFFSILGPGLAWAADALFDADILAATTAPSSLMMLVLYGLIPRSPINVDGVMFADLNFPGEPYFSMGFFIAGTMQWFFVLSLISRWMNRKKNSKTLQPSDTGPAGSSTGQPPRA